MRLLSRQPTAGPAVLEVSEARQPARPSRNGETPSSPPARPVAPGFLQRLGESLRRVLQGPTLTVSIEGGTVRVVVLRGQTVVAWGMKSTEEHLDLENAQGDSRRDGQAAALKELLLELGRGRVVTDLPLNDSLMRQLEVPEMSRRYVEPMVTSEVLETIPLFEAEADISWRIHRNHVRNQVHQEVFAAAVPKRAMDNQVHLLRDAGIRPAVAYSRAVALACAANEADAIVIHMEGSHVAIVVVHDGVPQFIHQVELPATVTSPQEAADAVSMAVEQASGYFQSLDEGRDGRRLPVVLTGLLPPGGPSRELMEARIEGEKLPFNPPLTYPEDFPAAEYPANIGLALADRFRGIARGSLPTHRGISVNLLPERHLPWRLPLRPVGVFLVLLLLGLVALGLAAPQVEAMESRANRLSARLTGIERAERLQFLTQARVAKTEAELANIQQQARDLDSHREMRRTEVGNLLAGMRTISRDALPRGAQISDLARQKDGFSFTGTAFEYEDVIQYKANLLDSGRFSEVQIVLIQAQGGVRVNFQINATVPSTGIEAPAEARG